MDNQERLKLLKKKISKLEKQYNKMANISEVVSNKSRDSTSRQLVSMFSAKVLTTDPLQPSSSVYRCWKRSCRNTQYTDAHKKVQKILSRLERELSELGVKRRKLDKLIKQEELKKAIEKEKRGGR